MKSSKHCGGKDRGKRRKEGRQMLLGSRVRFTCIPFLSLFPYSFPILEPCSQIAFQRAAAGERAGRGGGTGFNLWCFWGGCLGKIVETMSRGTQLGVREREVVPTSGNLLQDLQGVCISKSIDLVVFTFLFLFLFHFFFFFFFCSSSSGPVSFCLAPSSSSICARG